ncbi:hypothetical protein EC604_11500 [Paenibacillus amylolyticus]|jgi:hypothetical protein|uniref:Lipoprotein n=1 Tax=Paenibacillus amylolyticus TaxID=1451 RepID=A0A5M9WS70_PAEAM|nr:hypothetical protein [Paenibacillus amylolyticus]KAA8784470.1 hypothetical protein EC604_11500 [Paenibacillus amylolyticus]
MRKALIIILVVFTAVMTASCSTDNKEAAMNELRSQQQGTYSGYVFWNVDSDLTTLNKQLLGIVNTDEVMSSLRFSKLNFISMGDTSQKYNYVKMFDIDKSPTLLIFDTEKMILKTNNFEDIYTLANKLKQK